MSAFGVVKLSAGLSMLRHSVVGGTLLSFDTSDSYTSEISVSELCESK